MGATARNLLANLEQHVQGRARHEAIVERHHRFHDDAVAGLDGEHRFLRIVVPAQLRGLHGRGKQMDLPRSSAHSHDGLRHCRRGQPHHHRPGEDGQHYLGPRLHLTLPCFWASLNRLYRKSQWVAAQPLIHGIVSNYSSAASLKNRLPLLDRLAFGWRADTRQPSPRFAAASAAALLSRHLRLPRFSIRLSLHGRAFCGRGAMARTPRGTRASASQAATARAYTSPTLVLLAMDWPAGKDFADFLGFAILRSPGFRPGEQQGYLR